MESPVRKSARVIEIAGVVSGGKSTIAQELLKQNNIVGVERLTPIWPVIKVIGPSVLRNLLTELFFVAYFNLKLFRKVRHLERGISSQPGYLDKINLRRSIIRKVGFFLTVSEGRWAVGDKDVLIDEGLFQIIQNVVDNSESSFQYDRIFDIGYKPDLLLVVIGDVRTILQRCQSRPDLTRRFRSLQLVELENIINKSNVAFEKLGVEYSAKFQVEIKRTNSFDLREVGNAKLVILNNT